MASLFALPEKKLETKSEEDDLKQGVTDFAKKPELERSKLDIEIAKYLRFNVPRKNTVLQKQPVEYFVGSKAVDVLMASDWAVRKKGRDQYFVGREDAATFLDELLQKRFFYRVMKTEYEKKKKDDSGDNKESDKQSQNEDKANLKKRKKPKGSDAENEEEKGTDEAESKKGAKEKKEKSKKSAGKKNEKEDDKKGKEKTKKRYKIAYHEEQLFLDSKDLYVWVYNPVSWKTIAKGIGLLLLVAGGTLFPLWPDQVRVGVYYLSVTAGVFIGSVFVVALLRTILFGVLWAVTLGQHHLWLLPNLLEDVGFFESFKPLYSYEYRGPEKNDDDNEDDDSGEDSAEEGDCDAAKSSGKDDDTGAEAADGDDGDRDSQSGKDLDQSDSEPATQ